jgi:hypothetical protein
MVNNQYQQNEQSSSHLKSFNIKNTTQYEVGNPGPGFGQEGKCGRVKPMSVLMMIVVT